MKFRTTLVLASLVGLTWVAVGHAQVRVGWQSADVNVFLTYGLQTKTFEKHGVKLELKPFVGGQALLPAFAASEIDIGFMGEIPAISGYANGLPINLFMVLETYPSNVRLLANPQANVKSMADLRGKRIAATFGSTSHYHALLALTRGGLSQADATLVNMGQANMPAAYQASQIDAAIAWEPSAGEIEKFGGRAVATTESLGTIVSYSMAGRTEYLKSHDKEIQAFLRAWEEIGRKFQARPREVMAFEASRIGKSIDEYGELLKRQNPTRPTYKEQLSLMYLGTAKDKADSRFAKHIDGVTQFLVKLGRIKEVRKDMSDLIDPTPLTNYVRNNR